MKIKILKQTILSITALLLLFGCATATKAPSSNVGDTPVIRVGVCPDYPPVIYKKGDKICGIEAELADYIGKKLDAKIVYVTMPFKNLIPEVEKGKIDIIMSGMSDADIRKHRVRFVEPYMNSGLMAIVRKNDFDKFNSYTNVYRSLKIGCIDGTTGETFIKENVKKATHKTFGNAAQGIEALKSGEIDAFVDDAPFILKNANDNSDLSALPWLLSNDRLAWAMSKKRSSDYLYYRLNKIINHARQNGDLRRILNKYFEIQIKIKPLP